MGIIGSIVGNPILMCGLVALLIIIVLIVAVILCCKSSNDEREELKEISSEIVNDNTCDCIEGDNSDAEIELVLNKMQESLVKQESAPASFEQEQEEKAIISYQELLNNFGKSDSIDTGSIELFEDELENDYIEVDDFNKEIIDAYENESMEQEMIRFENDYSNQPLKIDVVSDTNGTNLEFKEIKKIGKAEVISPVYGRMDVPTITNKIDDEEIEEIVFDDFEDISEQQSDDEFLNALKTFRENL